MKIKSEYERLGIEYLVLESGDKGFRNPEVSRLLKRVVETERGVRGMHGTLRKYLNNEGYEFASRFCDEIISGGVFYYLLQLQYRLTMEAHEKAPESVCGER